MFFGGQGGDKIGHGGPLLHETSSLDREATATNQMHSNDLEAFGKKCCYFLFHSKVKFLTSFRTKSFLRILMQFLLIFIRLSALFAFILCNFHASKWKNAYIKILNVLRILMKFLCTSIYLGEKGEGVALMHVYVFALMHVYLWEHMSAFTTVPVGTRGLKSRMCPPYPHACRKRRLKWGAVI